MPTISSKIIEVVVTIAFITLLFFLGFVCGKASLARDIGEITGRVAQQNAHAKQLLNTLTAERDEKQAVIDRAYQEQEKKDATAKIEIGRLTTELSQRPVRVRVECAGGRGGGGSTNKTIAHPDHRSGNAAATYGVLPAVNSKRLTSALNAVELLNAAYNSCRNTLLFSH